MSKITLSNVGSLIDATTAQTTINSNFATIQTAMDNTLSRDGTQPNTMANALDMNGHQIINLPAPVTGNSPVRLTDIQTYSGGGTVTVNAVPSGGTTGQVLTKNSNTSFDEVWSSAPVLNGATITGGSISTSSFNGGTGASSTTFLRGDGTWAAPTVTSTSVIVGSVTVTGAGNIYSAAQSFKNILRSNSGSSMGDNLPGTGTGVLPANTIINVTNNDTSGLLSIGASVGATLNGPKLGSHIYLGPGQCAQFISDGSNYWTLVSPDRCKLTATTTLFVATTGNDNLSGLTSAVPFLNIQTAWNIAYQLFDLQQQRLIIQLADGTYSVTHLLFQGQMVGQNTTYGEPGTVAAASNITLQGNLTTPTNVVISGSNGGETMGVTSGASIGLQGFSINTTNLASEVVLISVVQAYVAVGNVDFGKNGTGSHVVSQVGGFVQMYPPYTISGGGGTHILSAQDSTIQYLTTGSVTISGTPAFASAFAYAQGGFIAGGGSTTTWVGSATGSKFASIWNGIVNSGSSGNVNYYPGSTAGGVSTGGQYL